MHTLFSNTLFFLLLFSSFQYPEQELKMGRSLILCLLICLSWTIMASRADVSYDAKSFTIDGKRRILISGSIHYPRSTPQMWPDLIQKAKLGGLEVVDTYVFWNGHEPTQGQYNFEGRYDLVRFIKLVQQAGLYLHLRIGPYVCAEWNFGGLPVWLKFVPGIEFRTDNEPYKKAMQGFTEKIVNLMKSEKLFQPQGGPIILAQIENEYDLVQYYLGATGKGYSNWAANMAVGLNTGVPWVMCKQEDAPDPVINSCNGFYCESFFPNKNTKPKMWTENWTGWLQNFGGPAPYRPVEDIAYSVARFIQNRGSFINYYMYHGGTNFGRTSGGPFIATSYDYDAPIDEYGLPKEPKWTHLTNLHAAIKKCEPALVSADPQVSSLGKNQEAHLFQDKKTGVCAAFLANYDPKYPVNVTFWNMSYNLPPWSVSILQDCKDVVFNTAMVSGPSIRRQMMPISGGYNWESYTESPASSTDPKTFSCDGLRDQVRVTWDTSDYLWYMIDVTIKATDLKDGKWPVLSVESAGHALDVFINGQLAGYVQGNADNPKVLFNAPVNLKVGVNKIALLSVSVGLANIGLHFDQWNVGILGPVTLNGLAEGTRDLSKQKWFYKIGMEGEALSLYASPGTSSVKWVGGPSLASKLPLTWYKTTIDAPEGNEALAIDMKSMGKGEVWINGESIGRHWPGYKAVGDSCGTCNYGGEFSERKCLSGCGEASQRWYHVPRSWVKPKGNILVVFEERGGDPTGIALVKRV